MIKTLNLPIRLVALIALMCLGAPPALAEAPRIVPDRWIVTLDAPPTVHYEGEFRMQSAITDGASPRLAATAPEVTGASRLDAHSPEVRAYAQWLDGQRNQVLDQAASVLGREVRPIHVYRHLRNGFSVEMSAEEAARLARMPGVRGVQPDEVYYLELDRGPQLIGADAMWFGWPQGVGEHRGENIVIGVVDSGINWDHSFFSDSSQFTGGYTYSNPLGEQLGECSQADVPCNDKLIGVYDFTDEGTDGKDPGGHGSHVAAIAAGNRRSVGLDFGGGSSTYTLSGVAPRANIVSYKVCKDDFDEDEAECPGSAIAQALDQAIDDGVHVLNFSIGSPSAGDPWATLDDPTRLSMAELFLDLRTAGIMPVTSAGNEGQEGLGSITAPANAPWAFSVGNSTHARFLANRADVAGLSNRVALAGSGPSISNDLTAPVIAADEVDADNFLACDSFPSGAFSGAIAVIMRGTCTFEVKVNNAHAAGAVGVLVVNHLGGPPITMGGLNNTAIPSFMLSNDEGMAVLQAMENTSNPTATIHAGVVRIIRSEWADLVAASSSRGPGPHAPNVMKPNLVAPGTSILAAGENGQNSYAVMTGTSMASPHIAGAVALLMSARPDWSLAMIQSALETTADAGSIQLPDGPADMLDRGAGRARVDLAVNAGLYLPIGRQQFLDANPADNGDPGQLNLAGIYSGDCTSDCQFTRTVRAMRDGAWTVTTEGDLDIEVTPQTFSLAPGGEVELSITVSGTSVPVDSVLGGAVVLTPSSGALSTQRLPVGMAVVAADLPTHHQINATANRGRTSLNLDVLTTMPEAVYRTSSLTRPVQESFSLSQDPTPNTPYSGSAGRQVFLVDVPADTLLLWVETMDSAAEDIRLYVGYDSNGNGQPEPGEEVCASTTEASVTEMCTIDTPQAGTWWIMVQNYEASDTGASDAVDLDYAVLTVGEDYSLVATGPGRHDTGSMALLLAWDQPAMRRHQRWLGGVGLASTADALADVGVLPVSVRRNVAFQSRPTAIFAGETWPAIVPPLGREERLFFDVSPGASSVSVFVQGSAGVSAELRRMDFDDIVGHAPGTPPADGDLVASGSGSTAGFEMSASAQAGRWYVVLDNVSAQEALVEVSVDIDESQPVMSQRGLWSPRDRVIYQGIEWQRAGPGFLTWYSYDADGLPVFYQAIAETDTSASTWTAPMDRISNPTGDRQLYDFIGEVSLTMLSDAEMVFAWRRDGFHGSEIMAPDAARTCPEVEGQPVSYSGHWYSPDALVGGTTMIVNASVQTHIRYYFDTLGVGRWLLADPTEPDPLSEDLVLLDYRGFCPGCEETDVEIIEVGTYQRSFISDSEGLEVLDFVTAAPLNDAISIEVPITRLSESMDCR